MRLSRLAIPLPCVLIAIAVGCTGQKDVSQTPQWRNSDVFGIEYQLTRNAALVKDKRTNDLVVVAISTDEQWLTRIGDVQAGTRMVVRRVVRTTEVAEVFIILPSYWTHDDELATIVNGPFGGKEVNLTRCLRVDFDFRMSHTQPLVGRVQPTTTPSTRLSD